MNEERFHKLYVDQFADVWRFIRRRSASSTDADDVVAETFAVAWRRREDLPDDDVRPWLFVVARHALANHRRSGERRARLHERLAGTRVSNSYSVDMNGEQSALWEALATLSEVDRDLLLMRSWDEMAVTEIATVLECTPNTVSSRLHRARDRLTRELARQEADPDGHVEAGPQTKEMSERDS